MSTPLYSGRLASSTRAAPRAPLSSLHASLSDSAYSDGLGAPSASSRGGGGYEPGRASRSQPSSPAHRHTIVALCAAATAVAYVERVGFAIAYAAAADAAAAAAGGARSDASTGAVLSAFYWGYALSQIPGGWAAARWGGSSVLTGSFALWSVATLLTPLSAGPRARAATAAGRVAVGVAQGALIPAMHTVLSQWIPPHERARATSAATSGMYAGAAAASLLMPRLVAAAGPSSAPRLAGGLGLAWLAAWRLAGGGDAPWHGQSPLPTSGGSSGTPTRRKSTPTPPPWRRMLASPAVWAITASNFAFHYAFYVVMNWMPSYFERVLGAPLAKSRGGGALPYALMFAAANVGGAAGDALTAGDVRSVAWARKVVNSVGFTLCALALLRMPAATTPAAGVAATAAALGAAGLARGGFAVNHMDIAPRHAGALMALSNTAGTAAGVIGVSATGALLQAAGDDARAGWRAACGLAAATVAGAGVLFAACARGERLFGETVDY